MVKCKGGLHTLKTPKYWRFYEKCKRCTVYGTPVISMDVQSIRVRGRNVSNCGTSSLKGTSKKTL